jgi:hypothetical protein
MIITKLFFTDQTKLSELNLSQLESILSNGDTTIYLNENGTLNIANKINNEISEKNAVGDIIKGQLLSDLPKTNDGENLFPEPDTGYGIIARKSGSNFIIQWGQIATEGNYNVISGDTTFIVTTTDPTFQIFNNVTPGNYKFNGNIDVLVIGDAAFASKRYTLDGGINFTPPTNSNTFLFEELGGLTPVNFSFAIKDSSNQIIYPTPPSLVVPLQLSGTIYDWDRIDLGIYQPDTLTHLIFKTDDYNPNHASTITVLVEESSTPFPGLYKHELNGNGNTINYETTSKEFGVIPITTGGTFNVITQRIGGGFIILGDLDMIPPILGAIYKPHEFTYSKDNGLIYQPPIDPDSYSIPPITPDDFELLDRQVPFQIWDKVRINFEWFEIGETSLTTKIFMRRNTTDEIYQYNDTITQIPKLSTSLNTLIINEVSYDFVDNTPFNSVFGLAANYATPTQINRNAVDPITGFPVWTPNPPQPDDFNFRVQIFIGGLVPGASTYNLFVHIEDLNGNTILTEDGVFDSDIPGVGKNYDFNLIEFDTDISPYIGQIVRVRLVFDEDINDPQSIKHATTLKYVRYA